jgi:nucleoside-diphosphate-sugar epimerase
LLVPPEILTILPANNINDNPTTPYSNAMDAYWASKALARIATRDFTAKKPHFDYVNLLPSVVIGPDERIQANGHVDELLSGARAAVLASALTSDLNSAFPYVGVPVHVADVARAHVDAVNAYLIPGNTEYILSSDTPEGVEWDRDVRQVVEKYFATEAASGILPLEGSLQTIKWRIDAMSTEEAFGWKFTSFQETVRQLIAQYIQLKGNGKGGL